MSEGAGGPRTPSATTRIGLYFQTRWNIHGISPMMYHDISMTRIPGDGSKFGQRRSGTGMLNGDVDVILIKERFSMKRSVMCLLLLGALPLRSGSAQPAERRYTENCVYAELFGQGILYSLNYEHRFVPSLSGRIGFTSWSMPLFFGLGGGRIDFLGVPVMMNYLTGEGSGHLELGAGIIVCRASAHAEWFWEEPTGIVTEETKVLGTATIGYRYQPSRKGMLFRIGFAPIFNSRRVLPTGGISAGWAF